MDCVKEKSKVNKNKVALKKSDSFTLCVEAFTFLAICDSLISIYVSLVPSVLRYAVLLFWLFVALRYIAKHRKMKRLIINLAPAAAFAAIWGIKMLVGQNFNTDYWSPIRLGTDSLSLMISIVMVHVIILLPKENKKRMLKLFLIFASVTVIPSLIYVQFYPDAVRDVYEGFANVGFQYVYAIIAVIVMGFYIVKSGNIIKKRYAVIFFITNMLLIIFANFATAFVCAFIGLAFMLLCTRKRTFKSFVITLCIVVALLLLLSPLIAQLCYTVSKWSIFSPIMQKRIGAIGDFLLGKGGGTSFGSRFDLMNSSFQTFLKHPLFGADFADFGRSTVGFHETWISLLGSMGIVGTALYCMAIGLIIKNVLSSLKVKHFAVAYKVILLLYLFMSFLNPLTFRDCLIALFVIAPMFELFLGKKHYAKKALFKRRA